MVPITFGLSLFVIWDQVSSFEIWIDLFLSKQKSTHRSDEGQCGCAVQLTPIEASSKRIDNKSNWKPMVATSVELACTERAVSFCIMTILHRTLDDWHWILINMFMEISFVSGMDSALDVKSRFRPKWSLFKGNSKSSFSLMHFTNAHHYYSNISLQISMVDIVYLPNIHSRMSVWLKKPTLFIPILGPSQIQLGLPLLQEENGRKSILYSMPSSSSYWALVQDG